MTIVLGIKADDGIVLASDSQFVFEPEEGKTETKPGQKIRVGENYALALTGRYNKYVEAFFSYLSGHRSLDEFIHFVSEGVVNRERYIDDCLPPNLSTTDVIRRIRDISTGNASDLPEIERAIMGYESKSITQMQDSMSGSPIDFHIMGWFLKYATYKGPLAHAIKTGQLREFGQLNAFERLRDGETETSNELLLAVNQPHLELYHVDIFGNMVTVTNKEGINYHALGRGGYLAKRYIGDQEHEDDPFVGEHKGMDRVPLSFALRLAIGALKKAYRELNTGGNIDLAVVRKDGVDHYGNFIRRNMLQRENELLSSIVEGYEQPQRKLF